MTQDELEQLIENAITRPFDEKGEYVWLTPDDFVEGGAGGVMTMNALQGLVHAGRLGRPQQIGDTMMAGWRSARH